MQRSILDAFHHHPPPLFLRWGNFLNLELDWQTKGPRNHPVYDAVAIGTLAATPTLTGCSLSLPPTVPRYKHTCSLAIGALAATPTLSWLLGIQACAASILSHCTSSYHWGWLLQAVLSQTACSAWLASLTGKLGGRRRCGDTKPHVLKTSFGTSFWNWVEYAPGTSSIHWDTWSIH